MTLEAMWHAQRSLSIAQAVPIIGPVVVSPVKAVVSLAQTIAGIAGTILFGAGLFLTGSEYFGKPFIHSTGHMALGLGSFLYSCTNMLTLGTLGICLEGFCHKEIDRIRFA